MLHRKFCNILKRNTVFSLMALMIVLKGCNGTSKDVLAEPSNNITNSNWSITAEDFMKSYYDHKEKKSSTTKRKTPKEFYSRDSYLKVKKRKKNLNSNNKIKHQTSSIKNVLNNITNPNSPDLFSIIAQENVLEKLTSELTLFGILKLAATSKVLYTTINECNDIASIGIDNHFPKKEMKINVYRNNFRAKNFHSGGLINNREIPSIAFYRVFQRVSNLSKNYWPHLKKTFITDLSLHSHPIYDHDLEFLWKCLDGTIVKILNLNNNYITSEGIKKIIQQPSKVQLQKVYLKRNNINKKARKMIRTAYPETTFIFKA